MDAAKMRYLTEHEAWTEIVCALETMRERVYSDFPTSILLWCASEIEFRKITTMATYIALTAKLFDHSLGSAWLLSDWQSCARFARRMARETRNG